MTYSKKLGLPNYSSHSCSVSLQVEIADVSQLTGEGKRLYALMQDAVDREIQEVGYLPDATTYGMHPPANGINNPDHSRGDDRADNGAWKCSDKQRQLVEKIVRENGLDKRSVEDLSKEMFGTGVKELNRLQASGLIDESVEMIAFADPSQTAEEHSRKQGRSIEELTRTVSASRLGTWLQCRLKFYFRYVAGVEKPPSPALHIGKAIHAVLQQWNLARWRGDPLDSETIGAVFDQAWAAEPNGPEIAWEDEEAASKANALAAIQTYLRETPIPVDEKPEGVEVSMEMDLASQGLPTLVGVIDLVRAGGRIVDFKTTGRTPTPEMVQHTTEIQTTGYALLYREATGCRESAIELHHLVKTKTPKLVVTETGPATDEQVTRLFRVIDSYVDGLVREDFVPAPGLQCTSCQFFRECRAWH